MFSQPIPGGPAMDPFYSSPFSSYFRRQTPYFGQPDYRIYEMNKRLQQRTDDSDSLWWDAFATEFFEDDATLTLTFCLEDGPKRYTIGRTLIPRYFRSIFEGGVSDLSFNLKHPKESFHNTSITLDCDQCTMVTYHGKSMYNKGLGGQYPNDPMKDQIVKDNAVVVCTEGRLILEFTFDDLMRIKSWHFATRQHRELVSRSLIAMQMSLHMERPPSKRRKRKSSAANSGGANTGGKKKNISPGPPNFTLASQDVMVVGEPSLMGGEFGDEDERLITRLENTQYDASAAAAAANGLEESEDFPANPITSVPSTTGGPPPSTWSGPPSAGAPSSDRTTVSAPSSSSQPASQDDKKSSPNLSQ
ncbi:LIM domain-binding protein 2 [Trichonephila inaurata madagascariensis]|uniref:LIM domain-binding protein 2 n=1 Tax=Trichonephila inaurata madagascariensis TaxID=2747483 RepID=A0A8X6KAA0_9ARAC|nr:LIM domain-binding protein 2 [Trichonephila inaurata madagascariensis]